MGYMKIKRKNQAGFSLIEILIAMALLSIIAVVFLSTLGSSSKILNVTNERQTARNIAEMQLEQIKSQANAGWIILHYDKYEVPDYPGYEAEIFPSLPRTPDTNIQRIEITVLHYGKAVFTLVTYIENTRR
jgi:prepilin-type N-terminal cleavage/methylation domain-containing protein